jgi:rubrerythrin
MPTTLEQEIEELRDWKESAMKQLRKAEHLREYLMAHGEYLGWDLYDAALDLLTKNCPCCGYPNCGHRHPVS